MLPQAFLQRMEEQLGEEYPAFLESFNRPRAVGLRANPLKGALPPLPFGLEPVPWARGATPARGYDRPPGRCNAAHCGGNGLPRRCAPRNDSFGCLWTELPGRFAAARRGRAPALRVHGRGWVRWDGAAGQIAAARRGTDSRPAGAIFFLTPSSLFPGYPLQ